MGVFGLHNAKNQCLVSGVGTQTPIPLYPIEQQRCFWIPRMGGFELHNAENYRGVGGCAPDTHAAVPFRPAKLSLDAYYAAV